MNMDEHVRVDIFTEMHQINIKIVLTVFWLSFSITNNNCYIHIFARNY